MTGGQNGQSTPAVDYCMWLEMDGVTLGAQIHVTEVTGTFNAMGSWSVSSNLERSSTPANGSPVAEAIAWIEITGRGDHRAQGTHPHPISVGP